MQRRDFLKGIGLASLTAALPFSLVEVVFGMGKRPLAQHESFTFAYISDSHLTHLTGARFTANFDQGLRRAIAEVNLMDPPPDFVIFGGDLAQLGKREELDHGLELLSALRPPLKWVIGEHDFYLDMGEYWQDKISPLYYSFDHKGVHFVVLNSILTYEDWINRWSTPMERMLQMARLDNPQGSPFMVGEPQLNWLREDLAKYDDNVPIIVLSHSPLYKIFKPWNFWTDDAEKVQALLKRFDRVTVLHGHVHQVLYNQIDNITFYAMKGTAWPWPYPVSYTQQPNQVPKLTVFMNRADPFHPRDGTGWDILDLDRGIITNHYQLWMNENRTVAFDFKLNHPVDLKYQDPQARIPPQNHY